MGGALTKRGGGGGGGALAEEIRILLQSSITVHCPLCL